jgi:putative transposase
MFFNMRLARIKVGGRTAVYHCISRVVGGQHLLDELGKEKLTRLLWKLSQFCGLEVITFCMMSSHFHVLIRVPEKQSPSDIQLLRRMEALYGKKGALVSVARKALEQKGSIDSDLRESMLERMGDVSAFMKELKQRFSRWYNHQSGRFGTLWAERFKSVVVEDQPQAVEAVAAYIDLNAVRAGIVDDPKDYRFCGYGAALAGHELARTGLMSFHGSGQWKEVSGQYRQRLFVGAGVSGASHKAVLDPEQIKAVLKAGGQLGLGQVLRLRIRHMSDGLVLGSRGFVNEVFALHRDKFGRKRKDGARPIRGVPLPGLSVLRDLRVNAIGP